MKFQLQCSTYRTQNVVVSEERARYFIVRGFYGARVQQYWWTRVIVCLGRGTRAAEEGHTPWYIPNWDGRKPICCQVQAESQGRQNTTWCYQFWINRSKWESTFDGTKKVSKRSRQKWRLGDDTRGFDQVPRAGRGWSSRQRAIRRG